MHRFNPDGEFAGQMPLNPQTYFPKSFNLGLCKSYEPETQSSLCGQIQGTLTVSLNRLNLDH